MSSVLVIAEHDGDAVDASTANVVAAAQSLGTDRVDVAIIAAATETLAAQAAGIAGVDRVLTVEDPRNGPYLASIWAPQLAALAENYSHVFTAATTLGKDLLPRVAALLGVGMLSDVTGIESAYHFRRPIYAGNAIARVAADPTLKLCATIRPAAFPALDGQATAPIATVPIEAELPAHTRFVARRKSPLCGPELQSADRVVAGGRGFGNEASFKQLEQLATALNAAIGASRAAVDAGWATNDMQVGQTGKIIAPSLYVAIGISGAIQHLTGIRDAGTVVVINRDADAPICSAADLVLIADLFTAVPELTAALLQRPRDVS